MLLNIRLIEFIRHASSKARQVQENDSLLPKSLLSRIPRCSRYAKYVLSSLQNIILISDTWCVNIYWVYSFLSLSKRGAKKAQFYVGRKMVCIYPIVHQSYTNSPGLSKDNCSVWTSPRIARWSTILMTFCKKVGWGGKDKCIEGLYRTNMLQNPMKFSGRHISEMLRKPMVWAIHANVKKESLYLTLPPDNRSHNALRYTLGCKDSIFYIWDFVLTTYIPCIKAAVFEIDDR